jgi:hypothetical protein
MKTRLYTVEPTLNYQKVKIEGSIDAANDNDFIEAAKNENAIGVALLLDLNEKIEVAKGNVQKPNNNHQAPIQQQVVNNDLVNAPQTAPVEQTRKEPT